MMIKTCDWAGAIFWEAREKSVEQRRSLSGTCTTEEGTHNTVADSKYCNWSKAGAEAEQHSSESTFRVSGQRGASTLTKAGAAKEADNSFSAAYFKVDLRDIPETEMLKWRPWNPGLSGSKKAGKENLEE